MPRPSHPLPYVRDDRETPLCVGRDANDTEVICVKRKCKYFCKGGWTGGWRHSPTGKISRPTGRLLSSQLDAPEFVALAAPSIFQYPTRAESLVHQFGSTILFLLPIWPWHYYRFKRVVNLVPKFLGKYGGAY
jgi:hypothetical protein